MVVVLRSDGEYKDVDEGLWLDILDPFAGIAGENR